MSVRTTDQAYLSRCCGPEGCGYLNPKSGVRWCLADGCMGWRWGEVFQVDALNRVHHVDRKSDATTGPLRTIRFGFCGLAGKP